MYIVIYLLSLCNFYDNLVNICVFLYYEKLVKR